LICFGLQAEFQWRSELGDSPEEFPVRWILIAVSFVFLFIWDVTQNNALWFHWFADLVRGSF
jgi:hypothetical protein